MQLFTKSEPIVQDVQGVPQNFYPISVKTLMQLRGVAKPLGRALAVLFGGTDDSVSKREIEEKTNNTTGIYERRTSVDAISADLAKQRVQQREAAVAELIDGAMNDASCRLLAMVIVDSMRDVFPKKPASPAGYDEILEDISGEELIDILKGIGAANRKLFGPLMERAGQVGAALKSNLDEKLASEAPPSAPAMN